MLNISLRGKIVLDLNFILFRCYKKIRFWLRADSYFFLYQYIDVQYLNYTKITKDVKIYCETSDEVFFVHKNPFYQTYYIGLNDRVQDDFALEKVYISRLIKTNKRYFEFLYKNKVDFSISKFIQEFDEFDTTIKEMCENIYYVFKKNGYKIHFIDKHALLTKIQKYRIHNSVTYYQATPILYTGILFEGSHPNDCYVLKTNPSFMYCMLLQ